MHVVAAIVLAAVLALTAAGPAAAATRYIVAPHDTLFSIARRFHVPLPLLAQVNGIHDPSLIRVGDVLIIPDVPAAAAASASTGVAPQMRTPVPSRFIPADPPAAMSSKPAATPSMITVSYIVQPGDTLYRLALTHGTTVQAVEAANGFTSPAIAVGQVLRLPRAAEPVSAAPAGPSPAIGAPAPLPPAETMPSDRSAPDPAAAPVDPALRPVPPVRAALPGRVRASALRYLGTPYLWGGTTAGGVDCSGLVYLVYSPYVANLPRTSYDQWTAGTDVERANLAIGDLVFFNTDGSGASHVGIYIGDGEFVHPAASTQRVVIDRLDTSYYLMHYLGARRVL